MRSAMHGQRTDRQGWGGYCGEQIWHHSEEGIFYRTVYKGLAPQACTVCHCSIDMHQTCCRALSSCEVYVLHSSPPMVGSWQGVGKCTCPPCREFASLHGGQVHLPAERSKWPDRAHCAYTHAVRTVWLFRSAHGLAISTSLPAICHQTRSSERPQNGLNDRTVSATGSCFGNLTPAGETVALMHPTRLRTCAIYVSAHQSVSTSSCIRPARLSLSQGQALHPHWRLVPVPGQSLYPQ